jgi:AraC family transcriptional regulator
MAQTRKTSVATLREYKQRLLRVLVHIQQHLDEALALDELATLACFSPYHFHRVFRGMTGESLMGHIRRLRLERAAAELKLSRVPVTQIAFHAGYETHEAFTRAFRASYGLAPIQFRSAKGRQCFPVAPSGVHFQPGGGLKHFKAKRVGAQVMKVQVKVMASMRVAFMRHVGPYGEVGATWGRLLPWCGKEGLLGGDSLFIGLCHDDPEVTLPEKLRYDACVTADAAFKPTGEIGVQVIPGGDYAVTTHFGPYHRLGKTYAALLGQWLPRSGRELGHSSCFEVYLNSPEDTDPKDLLTDIYVPLQRLGAGIRKGNR